MSKTTPPTNHTLYARALGIDTYQEAVIYLSEHCPICLSEGFRAQARVLVTVGSKSIIATLNIVSNQRILAPHEAGFSNYAWELCSPVEGAQVYISHPASLVSLSYVRKKIYGDVLNKAEFQTIVHDIIAGRLSEIHISAFLAACAGGRLNQDEITELTRTMTHAGQHLHWDQPIVVDKHCIGGLPGNRVTPIIVPIVTAFGLLMPKTSSRAITTPSGTADTLGILTVVDLTAEQIQQVVNKVGGCMVWGGGVGLSPADDVLIRVERALNLDSEGQMIASVLSKKLAAGATHVIVDIPIGGTVKVRSRAQAILFQSLFEETAKRIGMKMRVIFSDGSQPIGRGIGPALEARDVLQVLQNDPLAPIDLRDKALTLAGLILEFSPKVEQGKGYALAEEILRSGKAWAKFQAICEAQGGLFSVPTATYSEPYLTQRAGYVKSFDNRILSRIAGLAGAPLVPTAGIDLHVKLGDKVDFGQPLFTVHAESEGELNYALTSLHAQNHVIQIDDAP
jgi:thymidine phosphorylase